MRQHSIKTTILIHKTLVENNAVIALAKSAAHIQLLIGDPNINTDYPIINIKRDNVSSNTGNKDFSSDTVTFSIKIYSDDYKETVDLADAIRFALENNILQDTLIRLQNIKLVSCSEAWVSNAVEQSIVFSAEVTKPIATN